MDTQNSSVRPYARSRTGGKNHPSRGTRRGVQRGGVIHDNSRHTSRFTVIGNHLAQHAELSLLAIGLAVHIQSLPSGALVDIETLAGRFPEGRSRIAGALRELEVHGYLRRTRVRTDGGLIVTRTVSCNRPGRSGATEEPEPRPRRSADKPARRRALPAVPQPAYPAPDLLRTALEVLAGLRGEDSRLLLSATDAEHLVPGVAAWLERDLPPEAVQRALTAGLPPEPLTRPAALLAHRLSAQLPPLPPFRAPDRGSGSAVRHPLQNCDACDRAFRGPEPGTCAVCAPER
ncbi:helix-turn-helix domain-containing protein [Streptomyces sp. WAC05374]|uniref:helix-turn-helix domain-containing protein n=1 Tax=Streptomyces sp. WAC05374 TaxID=2487420 RepID=UPI000F881BA7|nr:helix-turn-helix domain-containing protein [Streptomyces sp. WAC05374]RST11813.1 helix-turn-helix domain-containing protein [Streptomyces sp. WAC05374]TDF44685.1 helix-turn-helix domain-containing protein [Streptomyces sp. WAC05374]TDF56723.1 helix-turn-helix domain-containing protein [Streptomyces sp. WAC05374]TDF59901.1 helix-turn-helix domain-containing protein [Streptomyces sp. WAC05374]